MKTQQAKCPRPSKAWSNCKLSMARFDPLRAGGNQKGKQQPGSSSGYVAVRELPGASCVCAEHGAQPPGIISDRSGNTWQWQAGWVEADTGKCRRTPGRGFGGFAACRPGKFVETAPEHQNIGGDADWPKLQNSQGTEAEPVMISASAPGVT